MMTAWHVKCAHMRGQSAGGAWTGASLNPARLLAGLIVFGCNVSPHPNDGLNS